MGLRNQAAADAQAILEDADGFGWSIEVTNPDGASWPMVGFSNDIAQLIDPDTGMQYSGRRASVALSLLTLEAQGLGIPQGVADSSRKPWVIVFDDIGGRPQSFKVSESNPDRALGIVTCMLEAYKPNG